MNEFSDARILESWHKNALPWATAVRQGQIESRRLVTDRAIVDAVLGRSPSSVLDIGCGVGRLARELSSKGIRVTGIDVTPVLVESAEDTGGGVFQVASYDDVITGRLRVSVDVVVCNFSLLGDDSVRGLFGAVPPMLNQAGAFIVQTVHPVVACGDLPYQDGWPERPAESATPPLSVTTEQFRSLAWLEGRWRGTLNDTAPFYEGYRFLDDSTLSSVTFSDSTALQVQDSGQIRLRGGTVITGDTANGYVLTALDSSSAHFEPRGRANNAFTWRREGDGTWTATLSWRTASGEPRQRVYVMRPLRP